jgi:endonuclease YncB( thermonuclease family)
VFSFASHTTHPKLTGKTVKFYNSHYSSPEISSKQKEWMIKGSIEEDEPVLRCQNHFYNPQTGRGLSDGKYEYLPASPAPDWANSPPGQSVLGMGGDYSWQRAVYHYQQGNKEKAFKSLGHVLHLLQDMGVPAHVRDDAHEAGDPFEQWLEENNSGLEVDLSAIPEKNCSDNRECFYQLASYAYSNFFSKDSIKRRDDIKLKGQYLYLGDVKLAFYDTEKKKVTIGSNKEHDSIHQSYWNHLSPQVVGYGAGLIDLFFREVKAEEVKEPDSALEYAWGEAKKEAESVSEFVQEKTAETVDKISGGFDRVAGVFGRDERKEDRGKRLKGRDKREEIGAKKGDGEEGLEVEEISRKEGRVKGVKEEVRGKREEIRGKREEVEGERSEARGKREEVRGKRLKARGKREEAGDERKETGGKKLEVGDEKKETGSKRLEGRDEREEVGVGYVVDGDTIILEDGRKVRYIGVDAPELGEEGSDDDEYLAWKARMRNMELLKGSDLRLVKDPDMDKDKYGRLLRYVYIDGKFVNKILAREGMASVFFCRPGWENCDPAGDRQRKKEIEQAGEYAGQRNLGIHNEHKKQLAKWKKESSEYQNIKNIENKKSENKKRDKIEEEKSGNNKVIRKEEAASDSDPSSDMPFHVRSGGGSSDSENKEEDRDKREEAGGKREETGGKKNKEEEQKESSGEDEEFNPSPPVSLAGLEIYDPVTGDATYTASTTVKVDMATTSASSSDISYYLSTSSSTPSAESSKWKESAPDKFIFKDNTQGEKTIFARLMAGESLATSTVSSSIFLDTKPPVSVISKPEESYSSCEIPLEWSCQDPGDYSDSECYFYIEYSETSSSDTPSASLKWKELASATTSTTTVFNKETDTDKIVYFRVKAEDKAGNAGEWSDIASTSVFIENEEEKKGRADHVVISRIYIHDTDDQIELYNPTEESIDLAEDEYRIERSTAGGGDPEYYLQFGNQNHGSFPGGTVIESGSRYVIADKDAVSSIREKADAVIDKDRGFALTEDNAVYLATDTVSSSTDEDIVDLVGYGNSPAYEGSGPAPLPAGTSSIERKALATSTASEMSSGLHKDLGNGYDSDNNQEDFIIRPGSIIQISADTEKEKGGSLAEVAATGELIENIEEMADNNKESYKYIVELSPEESVSASTTATGVRPATGCDFINTETGQVVNREGEKVDNSADPGTPEAPGQSGWVDPEKLPAGVVKMDISPDNITPSNIEVESGQAVALSVTASKRATEILKFGDSELSGVAVGVAPEKTRVIVFNASDKAGEYSYYSDMGNHRSKGAEGVMTVK